MNVRATESRERQRQGKPSLVARSLQQQPTLPHTANPTALRREDGQSTQGSGRGANRRHDEARHTLTHARSSASASLAFLFVRCSLSRLLQLHFLLLQNRQGKTRLGEKPCMDRDGSVGPSCAGSALTPLRRSLVCALALPRRRSAKYYSSFEHEEKRQLESEVHRLVTKRDPKFTNFIEVRAPRHAM